MNYFTDNPNLSFYLRHPECPVSSDSEGAEIALNLLGLITAEVIAHNAADVDATGPSLSGGHVEYCSQTQQNLSALTRSGLYGISVAQEYGGLGMSHSVSLLATEIIARADLSFATIWGLQDCADTISRFASPEVKQRFLEKIARGVTCSMDLTEPGAGSDLQSARVSATYDEAHDSWRLNGVKRFITNGGADIHLVLARSEPDSKDGRGLSLFLYDSSDGGMDVRRLERKMGIIGSPTAEISFHNAPAFLIGDRRMGLIKYVMSLMNSARLGVAAQSVGLCEAACREAESYASARHQFGSSIGSFIQVRELLRAMRSRTDAARSLLYLAARHVDQSPLSKLSTRTADLLTPLAKMMASEFANQCAYDCVQVHGGCGYMRGFTCERLYRDARVLSIYEGTTQMQVVAAAKGICNGAYLDFVDALRSQISLLQLTAAQQECLALLQQGVKEYRIQFEKASAYGLSNIRFEHRLRPLAERIALIIMGHQLLIDSAVQPSLTDSCLFIAEQL